MNRNLLGGALVVTLLCGCSQPPPPGTASATPFNTAFNMKQVMEWVVDPAADTVWESVAIIITDKGEQQKEPKTDDDWARVRAGAATLVEAGNLLMLPGRSRDAKWNAAAKRMSDAALVALQAVEKKNVAALLDSGAVIYNACSACHTAYRVGDDTPVEPTKKALPDAAPAKSAKSAK